MSLEIEHFEVHPVKYDQEGNALVCRTDEEAAFFGLYGFVNGKANSYYVPLGDFENRDTAERAMILLDNKKV